MPHTDHKCKVMCEYRQPIENVICEAAAFVAGAWETKDGHLLPCTCPPW